MTTEQKIAHIRWYVEQRAKSINADMAKYWQTVGIGALGAWFADMTISHETYNTLKEELYKEA